VTNNPDAAIRFAEQLSSDLAIKSLGALSVTEGTGAQAAYGLFTRRITRAELEGVKDKVCHLPTTFQQFIEKRCELRVTCVGKEVFACRIEARPGDLTADDYRFDTKNLNHAACVCPELKERLHAYMKEFGLNFAGFDFIVSHEGEFVFLEANANGQWLWVENLTGWQIGEAIAIELMAACGKEWNPLEYVHRKVEPMQSNGFRGYSVGRTFAGIWGGKVRYESKRND
jgi:hypothetical protein